MPLDNIADYLFARRNPDVSLTNMAHILDQLTWAMNDEGAEIEAARQRWLAGDNAEKVEVALLMDETFPYESREEMTREFDRLSKRWPNLAPICKKILKQWDQQGS